MKHFILQFSSLVMSHRRPLVRFARGFTLIELLTVIAVIGVLIGISVPAVNAVRNSAKVSQSRTQFNQYIAALESYYVEYQYYPTFTIGTEPIGPGDHQTAINHPPVRSELFSFSLTGRFLNPALPAAQANIIRNLGYNPRELRFYQFGDREIDATGSSPRIIDAFGNSDLFVVIDTDGDGLLRAASFTHLDLANDVRASVAFYSRPNPGAGFREVRSW